MTPQDHLIELAHYRMPFGKYKSYYLVDVPEYYYVWYKQKGFPEGKLGRLLQEMYEIKLNGLEPMIKKVQRTYPKPSNLK